MYQYVCDAWNRLVKVKASQGDHTLFTTYAYDGAGRRTVKKIERSGDLDCTEHDYYDGQKQIEARLLDGEGYEHVMRQYVWGTQYVDEIIRVDINGDYLDYNDDCLDAADASYYYHQDANWNVVAVTGATGSESGDLVQRISYSSYGRPTFTDATGRTRCGPTFGPAGNTFHTSAVAWQGLHLDLETGHTYNRARTLHHRLGRFMQRDRARMRDSLSLYEYVRSRPDGNTDPSGHMIAAVGRGKCCLWIDIDGTLNAVGALPRNTTGGPSPGDLCGSGPDSIRGVGGACNAQILSARDQDSLFFPPPIPPKDLRERCFGPTPCNGILGESVGVGGGGQKPEIQRDNKLAFMKDQGDACSEHVIIDDNDAFPTFPSEIPLGTPNATGGQDFVYVARYKPEDWRQAVRRCCSSKAPPGPPFWWQLSIPEMLDPSNREAF